MKHVSSSPDFNLPSGGYLVKFFASGDAPLGTLYAYDLEHAERIATTYINDVSSMQPNIGFHYELEELPEW